MYSFLALAAIAAATAVSVPIPVFPRVEPDGTTTPPPPTPRLTVIRADVVTTRRWGVREKKVGARGETPCPKESST